MSTLPPSLETDQSRDRRADRQALLDAPAALRFWHLASLDAPTVAVVWTFAFAWMCHIHLPLWLPVVLAIAAWCFYVADRLLDARNANTPLRARHHFHWRHRRIFVPLAIIAALAAIALVARSMPFAARERNSVLAAAALVYFTSVHSPWRVAAPKFRFPKELLVGVLFTLACAIPTLSRVGSSRLLAALPTILILIALAWLNCHAIESWESDFPGRPTVFRLALALAATALLATFATSLYDLRQAILLGMASLSAVLLAGLDHKSLSLTPIALRSCADLALLTPLLVLVIRV
ncbi:MAG TPA: hypothetical protein VHZ52_02235 [Acidobacteriaceae bacterium]|nr:hypothetical protein [Acidobacteriaceae bacterium]